MPETKTVDGGLDCARICDWLRIRSRQWPVDHYTLLGVDREESDLEKIENHAHERLNRVRCYQLSHPELATEAMNRLAEAYACLTDSQARRAYDAELPKTYDAPDQRPAEVGDTQEMTAIESKRDTATDKKPTVVDWSAEAPPPVRDSAMANATTEVIQAPADAVPNAPAEKADEEPCAKDDLSSAKNDPLLAAASASFSARHGIATRKGMWRRVMLTRKLIRYWRRCGRYVKQARRTLKDSSEEKELKACITRIARTLEDFPSFLGRPGKPGYRIAILADAEDPIKSFRNMNFYERDALTKDWISSAVLLCSYQKFLRLELAKRRKESLPRKFLRLVQAFFCTRLTREE